MTTDELRRVLYAHAEWILTGGERGEKADLRWVAFQQPNLIGATLDSADLTGAWLPLADLSGSSLVGTIMRGAYLHGADLNGTDMRWSDLSGAVISRADLAGCDLTCAAMSGTNFDYADFSGCAGVYCAGDDRGPDRIIGIDHGDHAMIATRGDWLTLDAARARWAANGDYDGLARVEEIAEWHKRLREGRDER